VLAARDSYDDSVIICNATEFETAQQDLGGRFLTGGAQSAPLPSPLPGVSLEYSGRRGSKERIRIVA